MKKLLLTLSIVFFALQSQAFQEGNTNLLGGVGVFGSRGLIGFSVDRFFTESHALTVAFGVDITGAGTMVGYKYFSEKTNNSKTVWDKCFFIFDCDSHFYAGGGAQYANATTIKISESGAEREYKTDPKLFGIAMIGFRDIYKSGFSMDFELSYRSIFTGGATQQTAGLTANDQKALELGYRSLGFGFAVGYLF